MRRLNDRQGDKVHTRSISVSTRDDGEGFILVEGVLKDERFQTSHVITGETFPAGVIHHMAVRLRVNCANLIIEDVKVDLIQVPRDVCRETENCLEGIKGLTISKGFTVKVKKLAGGARGCAHVVELLAAMAPAAIQGFAAHRSRNPVDLSSDEAKMVSRFLINTCHAWREDGPYAAILKKKFDLP